MNAIKNLLTIPDGIFQKNKNMGCALLFLAVTMVGFSLSFIRYMNCEGKDNQVLYTAIVTQDRPEVQKLLNAGHDPNSTARCYINDIDGYQLVDQPQEELPIYTAVQYDSSEITSDLLKAGADPDRTGKAGFPPMMEAINGAKYNQVSALLAGGANPNWQNPQTGDTPLIAAAKLNQTRNVQALLKAGATVGVMDKQGKVARDYAESGSEIADLLRR
jgi:ankyrin repeat protein